MNWAKTFSKLPMRNVQRCARLLVGCLLAGHLLQAQAKVDPATVTPPSDRHVLSGMWALAPMSSGAGMGAAPGGADGGMGGGAPAAADGMAAGGMAAGPSPSGFARDMTPPEIKPEYLSKLPQGTLAPNQSLLPNSDATRLCIPDGFFGTGGGYPTMIVQTANQITLINEEDHRIRRIYLDRQHPKNLKPSYAGHSIGHWEGNTLVVNTIGLLNRESQANPPGYYVEERFTRSADGKQLEWLMIFHSDAYAKPGTKTMAYNWRPDLHLQEQICEEFSDNFNDSYKFK